jgi:PIN domain nuclease of toxin-antitoxin system
VLLDTHALLWWLDGDRRLPVRVRRIIGDDANEIFVSAASVWEITTKARLGKLPGAADVADDVPRVVAGQGFLPLPVSLRHAQRAGRMPHPHRDPFDRMLAAQAELENLTIATNDPQIGALAIRSLW